MKKSMLTFAALVSGAGIAYAQIYDRGVTRQPNMINPFVIQQQAQSSVIKTVRPHKLKQKMRSGRHADNPAGHQFGDGSPPNTHIHGRIHPLFKGNSSLKSKR